MMRYDPRTISSRCGRLALGLAVTAWATLAPAAGATDLRLNGLLDLAVAERGDAFQNNVLTRGDSPFDPAGLRLFATAKASAKAQVFAQVVVSDASSLYLEGAYLMYSPLAQTDLHVLAGKVPWAIGTWAPRAYSNKNPLIGVPLIYSRHTSMLWSDLPANADQLLAVAGTGDYGVGYDGNPIGRGMPIVDDSYWDVGVTITGSQRPLEYALGVVAGAPGWASVTEDNNSGKSVLGRIGLAPVPALRVGVSGAYGPYLGEWLNDKIPGGKTVDDYRQKLVMSDLELLMGHVELRAEGARNFWETPTLGTLSVDGGYVESRFASPWGAFVAGRYDVMRFGKITNSSGEQMPWDDDTSRIETALGYRFSRDVTGKLGYQRTHTEHEATASYQTLELWAAQLSVGF